MVCPYAFDVPGGVQFHVRDLAENLLGRGHEVGVLAPVESDHEMPPWLTPCGRPVPVPYNGSVARLTFGPVTSARVGRWLDEGAFDILHIHEPVTPSASVLALWAATMPVVATFHTATVRSRAMHAAHPLLRPSMEKIRARIAVSEEARRTAVIHLKGDCYVIPNGVNVATFATAPRQARFTGSPEAPTLAFLGRIDEPRKGLQVLLDALPAILVRHPRARVLVAGPGDLDAVRRDLPDDLRERVELLGMVSDSDKAGLLASADLYIAPHTGGESFGIVLVEAMAAGAPVVASDLAAFTAVLGEPPAGVSFANGDVAALADTVLRLLDQPTERERLAAAGRARARVFDWSVVAEQVLAVYETVLEGSAVRPPDAAPHGIWGRLIRVPSRRSAW